MFGRFEAPAKYFGDDFGVVVGEVGRPSAGVGYGAYVIEVFGKECFPVAVVCGLYSTLEVCDSQFCRGRGSQC